MNTQFIAGEIEAAKRMSRNTRYWNRFIAAVECFGDHPDAWLTGKREEHMIFDAIAYMTMRPSGSDAE